MIGLENEPGEQSRTWTCASYLRVQWDANVQEWDSLQDASIGFGQSWKAQARLARIPFEKDRFSLIVQFYEFNWTIFGSEVIHADDPLVYHHGYRRGAKEIKRILRNNGLFLVYMGIVPLPNLLHAFRQEGFELAPLDDHIPGEPCFYMMINHKRGQISPEWTISESGSSRTQVSASFGESKRPIRQQVIQALTEELSQARNRGTDPGKTLLEKVILTVQKALAGRNRGTDPGKTLLEKAILTVQKALIGDVEHFRELKDCQVSERYDRFLHALRFLELGRTYESFGESCRRFESASIEQRDLSRLSRYVAADDISRLLDAAEILYGDGKDDVLASALPLMAAKWFRDVGQQGFAIEGNQEGLMGPKSQASLKLDDLLLGFSEIYHILSGHEMADMFRQELMWSWQEGWEYGERLEETTLESVAPHLMGRVVGDDSETLVSAFDLSNVSEDLLKILAHQIVCAGQSKKRVIVPVITSGDIQNEAFFVQRVQKRVRERHEITEDMFRAVQFGDIVITAMEFRQNGVDSLIEMDMEVLYDLLKANRKIANPFVLQVFTDNMHRFGPVREPIRSVLLQVASASQVIAPPPDLDEVFKARERIMRYQ